MYPVALNLNSLSVALVGGGKASWKRAQALLAHGIQKLDVYALEWSEDFLACDDERIKRKTHLPNEEELAGYTVVMIADIADDVAFALANKVRSLGRLVNVEDRKEYCDFYFSSVIARGDLLIGVNTGGKSPALSIRIRQYLESLFPEVWKDRLNTLGDKRVEWKQKGLSFNEVLQQSNDYIDRQGWLK